MKLFKPIQYKLILISTTLLLSCISFNHIHAQQKFSLGIHADPLVSWFSSDIKEVTNDGARPGLNFGLNYFRYFSPNYSFSTGISLISAGGRLISSDTTVLEFSNNKLTILPGTPVTYKINYLSIPIGLKLQTNQIGYLTFFTDLGIDPKFVIGGKADIPLLNISGENAVNELNMFNMAYHITAGIEYSLGGTTSVVLGLSFENNFLDITTDNGDQAEDKVMHKLLSFRMGVNF